MSLKRQRADSIRDDIVRKSKDIVDNYCIPGPKSRYNLSQLMFLDKNAIKKISKDIESFVDSVLELSDREVGILDDWKMDQLCPSELTKNQYCHMGSKKNPTRCEEMIGFDEPKRLFPQMYHILQDYGFFYIYLGV